MSRMIINRMRASFLKWIIKSVVKVVKNISAIRKIKEMTGYTKAKIVSAPKTPPRRSIENANMMAKWHPNIIICTFLISLNIVLFLLAKVNKKSNTPKENMEKFRLVRISMISFLHRKNEQRPNEGIAYASLNMVNCNVEIAILLSKKEFRKNSSLITRNAVSCCLIEAYSVNLTYITRHPTHHRNPRILLIIWMLYARFALLPLVTYFGVTSELTLQVVLYQMVMLCEGEEWVTRETKWITAATIWQIQHYNAAGDELQSGIKILFSFL